MLPGTLVVNKVVVVGAPPVVVVGAPAVVVVTAPAVVVVGAPAVVVVTAPAVVVVGTPAVVVNGASTVGGELVVAMTGELVLYSGGPLEAKVEVYATCAVVESKLVVFVIRGSVAAHLGFQRKAKTIKHTIHFKHNERSEVALSSLTPKHQPRHGILPSSRKLKSIVYTSAKLLKVSSSTQRMWQNVSGPGHNPDTLCSPKHDSMDADMLVK